MPEKDESKKPMYETPIVVPLGELAKGSGDCFSGASDTAFCTTGGLATTDCITGGANVVACTTGAAV